MIRATKNRDGLILDEVELPKFVGDRKVAPRLALCYSNYKVMKHGNVRVNGHKNRTSAIESKWNDMFAIDKDLEPISVVDIAEDYTPRYNDYRKKIIKSGGRFVVEITDTDISASPNISEIIINYNIGVRVETEGSKSLVGEDWFFFQDGRYRSGIGVDFDNFVLVVPNGNKENFYEQVDVGNIARIMNEHGGGTIKVCENLYMETFDKFAVSADIVITTPSTTAMELATLNKPMLLVKTSEDQIGDFSTIASDYSDDMLRLLLSRKDVRKAYGKNDIKNNINKVVNEIYETWEKWNNEQS